MGEHVWALVALVLPGHEHCWFSIQVGHDEVLVVRVFGVLVGCCAHVDVVFGIGCLLLTLSSRLHHPVFAICIRGVYHVGMSTVSPV